jgi:hypothetical protein
MVSMVVPFAFVDSELDRNGRYLFSLVRLARIFDSTRHIVVGWATFTTRKRGERQAVTAFDMVLYQKDGQENEKSRAGRCRTKFCPTFLL